LTIGQFSQTRSIAAAAGAVAVFVANLAISKLGSADIRVRSGIAILSRRAVAIVIALANIGSCATVAETIVIGVAGLAVRKLGLARIAVITAGAAAVGIGVARRIGVRACLALIRIFRYVADFIRSAIGIDDALADTWHSAKATSAEAIGAFVTKYAKSELRHTY
jgi:hypothetical protein